MSASGKTCQETGEKFKARGGRKHGDPVRQTDKSASDGDGAKGFWQTDSEGEAEDGDILHDLYPSKTAFEIYSCTCILYVPL